MIINDIWGRIVVDKDFARIINTKEFIELKNKTQLGLNSNTNVTYTRFQHSIGTYYLACKLIDICKIKFSNIISITKEDEWAIKCMALVHDLGHGCFSHVSEELLEGIHEDRTIDILSNPDSQIHNVIVDLFGKNVLKKVIDLLNMKYRDNFNYESDGMIFILSKLLSGGIDIDRIDYLFRDSYYVMGEHNDYSKILEAINLETVGDNLEIVYDVDAEYTIANFFNKRFELYDKIYLDNATLVLENIYGQFLKEAGINFDWDTLEIEMDSYFLEHSKSNDIILKRHAELLKNRKLDNEFLIKEINDVKTYENYKSKLLSIKQLNNYSSCLFDLHKEFSIYNKNNNIYINKEGLIKELSACSNIINTELHKEKYVLAVDLLLLRTLMLNDNIEELEIDNTIDKIKECMSNEIKPERKYLFESESCYYPDEIFKFIKRKLGMDLNLNYAKYTRSIDTYYDYENILKDNNITVRKSDNDINSEWIIEKKMNDSTMALKKDGSLEKIIKFLQDEWSIPVNALEEIISLRLFNAKYELEYCDGIYEIIFSKFIPVYDNIKYNTNYMIECKLKEGSSAGLYFINKIINSYDFIKECRDSKEKIAIDSVKNNSKPIYKKLVK